mmetsp:Transcript_42785/g.68694  ORF Transcript_42785/g.68694 Transcript_42785/m.68694 type:complete len:82 (+) Transcript_42785:151-396(+)
MRGSWQTCVKSPVTRHESCDVYVTCTSIFGLVGRGQWRSNGLAQSFMTHMCAITQQVLSAIIHWRTKSLANNYQHHQSLIS